MLVRFIGGPADGQVKEIETPYIRIMGVPSYTDFEKPSCSEYRVHKLAGEKEVFWIACEGSVDDALKELLFKGAR